MEDLQACLVNLDALDLLKAIKGVTFNFQSNKYLAQNLHEAKWRFYLIHQDKHVMYQD